MSSLINRTRQFLRAICTKITPSDLLIVQQYLNGSEQELFAEMSPAIRKHCINTAMTILNMSVEQTGINRPVLIKAALLHDIGKTRGSIRLRDRVWYILLKKVSPRWIYKLASPGRSSSLLRFRTALHIHLHHPEIGAQFAAKAGLAENLVYLIRHHHDVTKAADSKELAALMKADEQN